MCHSHDKWLCLMSAFLSCKNLLLLNSQGSGKEGPRKGPEMPWHFWSTASDLRAADEGNDSAEAANRAAREKERSISELCK